MSKEHKEPIIVEVARCLNDIGQTLTIHKLADSRLNGDIATELLKQYFYSELGREAPNIFLSMEIQEEVWKLWVNSKDENKLFPRLKIEFENKTREIFSNDENKIKRVLIWLNLFMEEWKAGAYKQPKHQDFELTEKAQQAFAKAIERGWMSKEENGCYRWHYIKGRGNKASLAYFLGNIYFTGTPWKELSRIFNESRLDQSYEQINNAKNRPRWRNPIDELLK